MRREWKIGETNVGIVGDSGGRGIKPYWHTYANRDMGKIRIEASYFEHNYADTEAGAEAMVELMAEVLNSVQPPTTPTAAAADWAGVTDPDAWLEEVRGQNNPTERK